MKSNDVDARKRKHSKRCDEIDHNENLVESLDIAPQFPPLTEHVRGLPDEDDKVCQHGRGEKRDEDPTAIPREGSGAEEDRQGAPFVGPSGKLLDRMLAAIGLARTDVYIANTLYWRPPGNRTPTPEERNACLPVLMRQIELVGPKVLVPLGGPAAQTLLDTTTGITRIRGQWFDFQTRPGGGGLTLPALPTFHPAFLLRQPSQKKQVWQDLRAIRTRLAEAG